MLHSPRCVRQGSVCAGRCRWRERVANRAMKMEGASSAVDSTEPGHASCADEAPSLACALHAGLQHMPMSAFDDARANWQAALAEGAVLHALLIRAVVADDVVEGGERIVRVRERQTIHQLGNGGIRRVVVEKLVNSRLPLREKTVAFAEKRFAAKHRPMHRVGHIEDLKDQEVQSAKLRGRSSACETGVSLFGVNRS